jgi:hypothetical protein
MFSSITEGGSYIKVLNGNSSATIVLNDFVLGIERSTAINVSGPRLLLYGYSIFTHIGPPNIVECARTFAVYTLLAL